MNILDFELIRQSAERMRKEREERIKNGQSFSQNIDEEDFVIDDFELSSVMSKYVDMMEIPNKEWVLGYLLKKLEVVMNK